MHLSAPTSHTAAPVDAQDALYRAHRALQGVEFIAQTLKKLGGPSDLDGWEEDCAAALEAIAASALPAVEVALEALPSESMPS